MIVNELASAVYNDIIAGLAGYASTPTISIEQLEQEVVEERLKIIKQYALKNLIPKKDLMISINCIELDCKSMDKCCYNNDYSVPISHFEIPQLLNDFGDGAIDFIGSTDKQIKFKVYTNRAYRYHHLKMRGNNKPYVYIDTTPNENNMYDAFVFNAPLLKRLSVVAIFKDLRQVEEYACCLEDLKSLSFIDSEVKESLTKKKLYYYRQNYQPPQPNNQIPR